ncbi:dihydrolipoyl dehydrogenase [Pseudoclavibacter sp. CFCC 13796]|uniref:dihydrolipoyl dehydrogenase n=1 Tax=unclassified Pseudoclavibacter TaxID=2615177 RepID=UPI001300CE87|nr:MULTISPECIES: dihydrolipoyl dehydrogenase [unclassified Pseudoclavibacter]KAB1661728.1 dihydrolipoyl dehydrogenase [Pseudoclavibacter sp. CFCC 13796]KAB1663550.1 dihydrolipoyl dehydrogenase [Pseudoclavibacter sp. CFCC 13611]
MSEHEFDLVVLGGGSGGYAAALRARELGSTVALIEKDKLGGTCLHRGCVPTKALLHTAEIADEVRTAGKYGIEAALQGVDIQGVNSFRAGIISSKFKGLQGLVKARGVEVVAGEGRLTDAHTVTVGSETYRGKNVVLATGSYSKSLPGLEIGGRIITSEQALELTEIPKRVIVLGGGVIGVEFASVWNSWGADVTIVEGFDHLVPNEELSISKYLERVYKQRGIKQHLGVRFKQAAQTTTGVTVTLEDGTSLDADYLLVAVGRGPVTQNMGFEEVGVTLDRGFVPVDETLQTSVPGVYAVGDIVPGLQLAHRAYQQGIFVAEQIAGLDPVPVADVNVPKVTYCEPQVFSVGLTEAKAKAEFGDDQVSAYEYNLAGNAKSSILGTGGFVKLVRRVDGPIVGVHGIGGRLGELVGEAQLIVNWEAYPEDVAQLIHAHPTQTETIGEAALYLAGKPLHAI